LDSTNVQTCCTKGGGRAVEEEGLTTQQWVVMGALSREKSPGGMSIGDLARAPDGEPAEPLEPHHPRGARCACGRRREWAGMDRRSRVVTMTNSGRHVRQDPALPKIHGYYEAILADFSVNDVTRTLHYLLKILENMQRLEAKRLTAEGAEEAKALTWRWRTLCGACRRAAMPRVWKRPHICALVADRLSAIWRREECREVARTTRSPRSPTAVVGQSASQRSRNAGGTGRQAD
jgi:hypothetical protein